MRPALLGAVCAALVYAAAWQMAPRQLPVELQEVAFPARSARALPSISQPPVGGEGTASAGSRAATHSGPLREVSSQHAVKSASAKPSPLPRGRRLGEEPSNDLAVVRQQAIDFKKSLPEPVQRALKDVSNLRGTKSPDDLARQVQALDPERANLDQLRSFAQEFVDVPADELGEGRFARDRRRALGSSR